MERMAGTVRHLCDVDPTPLADWIAGIPLSEWPQQDRIRSDSPWPAMVSDPDWNGYGEAVRPFVEGIMDRFPGHRADHVMLSLVVAGQKIRGHDDFQPQDWRTRVHIPIQTNPDAIIDFEGDRVHIPYGEAWEFNCECTHSVENNGMENRIHLFFDVREGVNG